MKTYILLPVLALANLLNAQEILDTIYANEHNNVALFFPNPIRQGIVGGQNFVFTYNRERGQHFGLLQASPGKESNLLVVTIDGRVYSYILKYQEQLSRLNHFVVGSQSIGTERPMGPKQKRVIGQRDSIPGHDGRDVERFCDQLLKSKNQRLATKRKKGIGLQLQNWVYQGSMTYLVMQISNNSEIDLEVDYLNVYRVNGNKGKKASYQKLEMVPLYKYKMPSKIMNGSSKRFVYALPKFVLGDTEELEIELKELNGNRRVGLKGKR